MRLARAATVGVLLSLLGTFCQAASLESIVTPRGVTQRFILIEPERPLATVVLFAGGHGALGLSGPHAMTWGSANFLVRSRHLFAQKELMVAVVDAPSDKRAGMNAIFRVSSEHADDIAALVGALRNKLDAPVWLVGTSMGTFSALRGAMAPSLASGLVLTSPITRSKPGWHIADSHPRGIGSLATTDVKVPTLILAHKMDACELTPPRDADALAHDLQNAKPVKVILVDGGLPPQSPSCEARSAHGFLGIEAEVVAMIADFIRNTAR